MIVTAASMSYRNMVQAKVDAAARITEKIDLLLKKECKNALAFVKDGLLEKRQKKSDYRPDDLNFVGATLACQAVCSYVGSLASSVLHRLDPGNATAFLEEFGIGLFQTLLDHLRHFTISDAGAMVLQKCPLPLPS